MVDINRRNLMATSVAAALGASVAGSGIAGASNSEIDESDTSGAPSVKGDLKRFSNTAYGAEVTGPYVFEDGSLLYSLQHPSTDNEEPYDRAGVGYTSGFQFDMGGSNDDFEELSIPTTKSEQERVRVAEGEFVILAYQEEPINDGEEQLGVPETPYGVSIEKFAGSRYAAAGYTPDCNQFVASNEEGTEGHLFTNFEASPGNITRIPISQDRYGEWEADLDNALNLANTESLRALGGTRINCYGDKTPWDTMVSSEENYAHPRVSLTNTVGDMVEAESGVGIIGAAQFWNRPNPSEIQGAVNTYAEDGDISEGWYVQGYWANAGAELLAYYLGAGPNDNTDLATDTEDVYDDGEVAEGNENELSPIGDGYPNQYRYGYQLDFRDPHAEEPTPVKYYVMGRASWEAPDFQNDLKTVYGCSDGDSKGIYKFVADEEIPSYEDPMDVSGTLYAPKVTNDSANVEESGSRSSPADVNLDFEWMELGHATNAEIEEWITEYDDVTQEDYLAIGDGTNENVPSDHEYVVPEDAPMEEKLKAADLYVIHNGNPDYITNEEIVEWAEQYEANGPDGVDDELRKVPFLETRAAAKEIGASIEFNKAEGVDSVSDAAPGDYVYFGISEFNDDLSDETGDVRMDRVDGGVVYRGELEEDYNVSTLEPVIVGPDFTDPADVANDSLRNIDNVYVMDDGRVLCCEDGFAESNRSYPNDCLYVYQPNPIAAVGSAEMTAGESADVTVSLKQIPEGLPEDIATAGAELTLTVGDTSVATVESASYADELMASSQPSVSDDGSSVTHSLSDVNNAPASSDFPVATITLSGAGAGETELTLSSTVTELGETLELETQSGTATVEAATTPTATPTATPDDGTDTPTATPDDGNNGNGNNGNNGNGNNGNNSNGNNGNNSNSS